MSVCLLTAVIVAINSDADCVRACVPAAAAAANCMLIPWGLSGVYRFICASCLAPPRGIGASYHTSRPRVSTFGGRLWRPPAGFRHHITTVSCCTGSSCHVQQLATHQLLLPIARRCSSLAAHCCRRCPPQLLAARSSLLYYAPCSRLLPRLLRRDSGRNRRVREAAVCIRSEPC